MSQSAQYTSDDFSELPAVCRLSHATHPCWPNKLSVCRLDVCYADGDDISYVSGGPVNISFLSFSCENLLFYPLHHFLVKVHFVISSPYFRNIFPALLYIHSASLASSERPFASPSGVLDLRAPFERTHCYKVQDRAAHSGLRSSCANLVRAGRSK